MAIAVKKKISLEFLGDQYKDAYLELTSVPMREYTDLITKVEKLQKGSVGESIKFIQDFVCSRFVSGKFPNESGDLVDITADDILDLDADTFNKAFAQITGQTDPKS